MKVEDAFLQKGFRGSGVFDLITRFLRVMFCVTYNRLCLQFTVYTYSICVK